VQALRTELEVIQHLPEGNYLAMRQHLLSEIAAVVAAQGHHIQATRLFSHAPERFFYDRPNLVQSHLDQYLAACRAALGDVAFAAAWAQGQQMTLEQAVAEALDR
jgi:hypothetical protein